MASAAEIQRPLMSKDRELQLRDRVHRNMTESAKDLLELYEHRGWQAAGYPSWRSYVTAVYGQHERTLYRQLEAAKVAKEIELSAPKGPAVVQFDARVKNKVSERKLRELAKAPEGTRAEVLDVAIEASGGDPTGDVVKAAVEAKWANPDATPAELVKAVVEARPRPPKAVVPECVEDVREELAERAAKRDEVDDDEWLASLPLSSALEGHALDKFRRDALDYRDLESTVPARVPLRKAIAEFLSRARRRQKGRTPNQGFTAYRAGLLLSVEHPRSWFRCPPTEKGGCGGTGTVGSVGQCPMCFGRGYLPR